MVGEFSEKWKIDKPKHKTWVTSPSRRLRNICRATAQSRRRESEWLKPLGLMNDNDGDDEESEEEEGEGEEEEEEDTEDEEEDEEDTEEEKKKNDGGGNAEENNALHKRPAKAPAAKAAATPTAEAPGDYFIGFNTELNVAYRTKVGQTFQEPSTTVYAPEGADPDDPPLAIWADGMERPIADLTCRDLERKLKPHKSTSTRKEFFSMIILIYGHRIQHGICGLEVDIEFKKGHVA